jgi:hypothetical protein
LESGTYEVFERDPIKYRLYENAVYEAIKDKLGAAGADGDKEDQNL